MEKLHVLLRPKVNLIIIIILSISSIILGFLVNPSRFLISVSIVLGLIYGFMQTMSINEAKEKYLLIDSVRRYRKTMRSTKWGKIYFAFFYTTITLVAILCPLISAFYIQKVPALVSPFFVLFVARLVQEIITLRKYFELDKLCSNQGVEELN